MVVIRLTRVGKKNSPAYRVVVAEKRRAVKRKFIEVIGHYNPIRTPKEVSISSERALFWLKAGAQPSDTVRNLMADQGIIAKKEKVNIKYARDKKKKELKAEAESKGEAKPQAAEEPKAEEKKAEQPIETPEESKIDGDAESKETKVDSKPNEEKEKQVEDKSEDIKEESKEGDQEKEENKSEDKESNS